MAISMTPYPPQNILYIDDDLDFAVLVKRVLEHLGHAVSIFDRPEDALEAIRRNPGHWNAVVTDYNMPGTDGLQVARAISSQFPHLPCAVVSSFVTGAMTAATTNAGLGPPLLKPASVREFDDLVRQVAGQRCAAPAAA